MKVIRFAALLFAIGTTFACAPEDTSANEEVVLRMIEAINSRDFDALDEVVSQTVRRYSAATPEVQVTSLEEVEEYADKVADVCEQARLDGEVLQIANYLCPGNIVISGDNAACEREVTQPAEAVGDPPARGYGLPSGGRAGGGGRRGCSSSPSG